MKQVVNLVILSCAIVSFSSTQAMHLLWGRSAAVARAIVSRNISIQTGKRTNNKASAAPIDDRSKSTTEFLTSRAFWNGWFGGMMTAASLTIFAQKLASPVTMTEAERWALVQKIRERNNGLEKDFASALYPLEDNKPNQSSSVL